MGQTKVFDEEKGIVALEEDNTVTQGTANHVLPSPSDARPSTSGSSLTKASTAVESSTTIAVQETPNGYPRLAVYLDSDENFMLYRRFGYLQSRLLLEKQDDLRRLEHELGRMDANENRKAMVNPEGANTLTMRRAHGKDHMKPRADLMQKIEEKWLEYSQLLSAAKDMVALNKPTNCEYNSVSWWMNSEQPLESEDAQWILHKEDVVTLRPGREHAWLDAMVETLLRKLPLPFIRNLFRSEETRLKMAGCDDEIAYYTRERISYVVNTIMILVILVLLVVPVYILFHVTDNEADSPRTEGICVGVLLISTLAFSAAVSLFSRAKRHEVLAASAA
ncbi:hypothetical protein H2200_011412 [Cladophialophora chaetospira]|uniref:DUF6594 domain-containing protein n=1 Tax=Cladophialophora chaetospira TaxID=386627 RepID=A0AA39CD39_9EURO|nr:hypothetical protein H2200_011412 [Cladophialophora chaetospira]